MDAEHALVDGAALEAAQDRLAAFLELAARLTPDQVRRLGGARPAASTMDPDFLLAVADGRWSREHEAMARHAREQVRSLARQLTRWRHRRGLAAALSTTALVVVAGTDPQGPLDPDLRTRLCRTWVEATGHEPCLSAAA